MWFFSTEKPAYEMRRGLVGSEMCIGDRPRWRGTPSAPVPRVGLAGRAESGNSHSAKSLVRGRTFEPANCVTCGRHQKLLFRNGLKTRDLCSCSLRLKRRRLSHKQSDVSGAFEPSPSVPAETVSQEDAMGHVLMVVNSMALTWCSKCGSYTKTHVKDLGKLCKGAPGLGKLRELVRLRAGRHPVTNEPVGASSRLLLE